jgi:uncharacterized protein DUF4154
MQGKRPFPLTRVLTGMVLGAMLPALVVAAGEPEDELKAAIVLSFLRYGEWSQPLATNAPFTVGVFGRASFADVLRRTLENKTVNQHAIHIVELKTSAEAQGCQVIYFASGKTPEAQATIQTALSARALTIGESNDFLDIGGAVNLLVIDGRMSFEVSLETLEHSGVTISSKLLRFGQIRSRKKGVS